MLGYRPQPQCGCHTALSGMAVHALQTHPHVPGQEVPHHAALLIPLCTLSYLLAQKPALPFQGCWAGLCCPVLCMSFLDHAPDTLLATTINHSNLKYASRLQYSICKPADAIVLLIYCTGSACQHTRAAARLWKLSPQTSFADIIIYTGVAVHSGACRSSPRRCCAVQRLACTKQLLAKSGTRALQTLSIQKGAISQLPASLGWHLHYCSLIYKVYHRCNICVVCGKGRACLSQ